MKEWMKKIKPKWSTALEVPQITKHGMYNYRFEKPDFTSRFHLRVDSDGTGFLLANASFLIYLNKTAVDIVKLILDGKNQTEILKQLTGTYRNIPKAEFKASFEKIKQLIDNFSKPQDEKQDPFKDIDIFMDKPLSHEVAAPVRSDLVLTYRCNVACSHCYVEQDRKDKKKLEPDDWKKIIKKLFDAGIPYVTFTGGEPLLYENIVELIEYAEDIGVLTGLLTNGSILKDRRFAKKLAQAGLDHVQITLESSNKDIHNKMVCANTFEDTVEGIKNCLAENIHTITNTTITKINADSIEETLDFINSLGVKAFAANSLIYSGKGKTFEYGILEGELEPIIAEIKNKADKLGMRFIWYTPTRYCVFNPVNYELGFKRCSAASYSIAVEPDGEVIPCQSYFKSAGNILNQDWNSIWESELFVNLRQRKWLPEICTSCPMTICGGGCPLYPAS